MKTPRASALTRFLPLLATALLITPAARATDGVWNNNAAANWSLATNWTGSAIADGAGSTADFSLLNISAARTVTIDGTVASRTVGTFLIGDSTTSFFGYTIAASGGGTLTFNNNGSTALLTQTANSGANNFSAPLILADNLNVTNNNATSSLSISGGITGAKNLALNANDAGGITLQTADINNGGTITNSGTGSGTTTINSIINTNVTGVVQNSANSQLTLSGVNTFTTGVTIKNGTVLVNNTAALGTGTLLLGDTTGNANATLLIGSFTPTNNITVQATGTGTRTIASNGGAAARPTGNILLNNNLTLMVDTGGQSGRSTGAYLATSGTISGTGNLNLNVTANVTTANDGGTSTINSLSVGGLITTSGNINNVGTGGGLALISGDISNASSVNQNSATSMLTLTGANTYAGATNVNVGVLRSTSAGGLSINSAVTVAAGAALQLQGTHTTTQTLTLSGQGTAYSDGALSSLNVTAYAGTVALAADSTISSTLANTTLTLSGGITGTGRTLTTSGVGTVTISGNITTGTGDLIKTGSGNLTLSGANTFSGLTQINNGAILLSSTGALGGGGNITFNGGTLRHSTNNTADYASHIVNSTGPISIDTNNSNVTYASGLASSNTGGLTKLGTATLTLSGTNAYTGITAINNGGLAFSSGSLSSGNIFIDAGGVLNGNGAYATAQDWLNSGKISTSSTGGLALTDNSDVNLTGYGNLMLVTSTGGNTTYTGTITPTGGLYRLGGTTSSTNLTLSSANALTGTNGLVVGAKNGVSSSAGSVILSNSNDLTGSTTVTAGTLSLTGTGTITGSAVTVNSGAAFAVTANTTAPVVARAASVTLNGGTMTVAGNNTVNSTDAITSALTIGSGGNSIVTVSVAGSSTKNALLTAGSLVHSAGGTALIRGANLGVNAISSTTANSTNIQITTPNLVGDTGTHTTDGGILVGVVGDTASNGNGFAATGGLLTYDATKGVRLLSGSDYKTSIADGQSQLDNVQLSSASGVATTTLNSDTTINSLSLKTSGATNAGIAITGTGKLTLNSGVIYSNSVTATTTSTISNNIDFNGREGVVLVGGSNSLTLSGVLSNTGSNGLTVYGSQTVTLSGTSANTYTGTTTVNGGTLALNKTAGLNSIGGNLVVNAGNVSMSTSNQIADSANVTINGGSITYRNETINNLTMTGGSANTPSNTNGVILNVGGDLSLSGGASMVNSVAGQINVTGATNLSDGGTITLRRSQNVNGSYDSVVTLAALNITNTTSGAYTPITINHGNGYSQSGGQLVLGGDVTFTGNATNANTVLIDAIKGSGRQGVIALTVAAGNRTFTIGDGAAATDLRITAALLDGAGGTSGLVKAGLGTLALSGANTYSGNTTVNAGTLTLDQSGSLTFYIGANGTNNSVTGTATATFNGSFDFDLSGASLVNGNSWTIANVTTQSFAGSFFVQGFTETANVWTNGTGLSFSEATGILSYSAVPEPSTYALLGGLGTLLFAVGYRRRARSASAV